MAGRTATQRTTLPLRSVTAEEFRAFAVTVSEAFGERPTDEEVDSWSEQLDLERTRAASDAGRFVATSATQAFELTVPGGLVPMAGVTAVAVLPSHRRRGLAAAMITELLADAHQRGEPVAGLWASESSIYGRFGFGWATSGWSWELRTVSADFAKPPRDAGAVRMLDVDEALVLMPKVYEQLRRRVPGMLSRNDAQWRHWLARDPENERDGAGPRFLAAYESSGAVAYRIRQDWSHGFPSGTLVVEALYAADDETYAGLWRWVLDVDLVDRVRAAFRPVDEPLALLLADPRRLHGEVTDALWLRLVDVPAALTARRYAVDGVVVVEVIDEMCPWNAGRWRLQSRRGSAACERTDAEADLVLDVSVLGSIYLGGQQLSRFARAGHLDVHSDTALKRADAMFAATPAPWCPFEF